LDGTDNPKFDEACNHLIKKHGLKCLHVGQETTHGSDGETPWQFHCCGFR
jgi:hypothetical protein